MYSLAIVGLWTIVSLSTLVSASSELLFPRGPCQNGYSVCSPPGAQGTSTPQVGSSLSDLYVDVLDSIAGVKSPVRRRGNVQEMAKILNTRDLSQPVCCAPTTTCLLLQDFAVPFCYDRFTTNYFLPDGSYGSVVTGSFTGGTGGTANLLSGNYTDKNGMQGNIYAEASTSPPNTMTLTLPTPYTASGVGSAIPASNLGDKQTYTTTIPGTTIEPSTVAAQTISAVIVSATTLTGSEVITTTADDGSTTSSTVMAASTITATTESTSVKPGTTISGTTKGPQILTLVTDVPAGSSATASSKHNGGDNLAGSRDSSIASLMMSIAAAILCWL